MLVEFHCDGRARWPGATATNMPVGSKQRLIHGYCNMPASFVKLYRHNCLVSDMYAGPDKVEQTCTLARCNLNRHARWSSATVPSIPVS